MTDQEPAATSPTQPQEASPTQVAAPLPPTPPSQDAPAAPVGPVKAPRNVLALVALIVSIVGFIFACVPGALVIGWVLLPIAFILSIVSLFMKGSGKGLGIAGLIVSVVGTIVGFIVFFVVAAASFNDAFSTPTTVVEQPTTGDAPEVNEAPSDVGTRDNPAPLTSAVTTDDWTVVVNSYNVDGNQIVADANSFNEAPAAGSHYEIVTYTVTYTGKESAIAAEVMVDLVTSSGNVIKSYDNLVVLEDTIGLNELFNGASVTGSVAFLVPDGETALVRVQPGLFADEVFLGVK